MLYKLIQWFKRNACKDCDYYYPENNVCQSKKCETCGCHPYVNWFDRHFCQPYKASPTYKIEVITRGNCMICGKELTGGLFFCKECEDKYKAESEE